MKHEKLEKNNYRKGSKKEQYTSLAPKENSENEFLNKGDSNKLIHNNTSISSNIGSIINSLKPTIELTGKNVSQMVNAIRPIQKMVKSLMESLRPIINEIVNAIPDMNSYFGELANTIKEIQKNPDSVFNWIEFSKSLSNYFWLPPYLMQSSEIMELLKTVDCEQKMDEELEKYFTDQVINSFFDEIINKSFAKHKEIMIQIKKAYFNESYALANTGLFSIIDSLCGFFVENKKKNTYRINIFEPILRIEKRESSDYYNILVLSMINDNINFLYGENNSSHKLARRHLSQHGEFFSNNRIDTIMLLHTTYYLLMVTDVYKKYKKSLKLEVKYLNKRKIVKYKFLNKMKSNKQNTTQ